MKKQDKTRMQAEDSLVKDKENDYFTLPFQKETSPPLNLTRVKIQTLKDLSKLPDIYERLTKSPAPSIRELEDIRKGLLCQLFGGFIKNLSTGAQCGGDMNVLLIEDLGTSKSQLLQYIHKLAPQGIYTSGRGSSAMGLTAYVTN